MPKPIKKFVPVTELKTTTFTDVIEIERTITPDESLRVDHVFIRRKKINKSNPAEIFETEETARYDIAWPEEFKEETKEKDKEVAKQEQIISAIKSE